MKLIYGFTAFFFALAASGLTGAVTPASNNLNGLYTLQMSTTCQQVGGGSGTLSQTIGLLEFTPSAAGALSGAMTASFTQLVGGLKVAAGKSKISLFTDATPLLGTYSITLGSGVFSPATIILIFDGSPALTFTGYLSQGGAASNPGVFDAADFVSVDDPNDQAVGCETVGSMHLVKAAAPPA